MEQLKTIIKTNLIIDNETTIDLLKIVDNKYNGNIIIEATYLRNFSYIKHY